MSVRRMLRSGVQSLQVQLGTLVLPEAANVLLPFTVTDVGASAPMTTSSDGSPLWAKVSVFHTGSPDGFTKSPVADETAAMTRVTR